MDDSERFDERNEIISQLKNQLETERMRLVACGVIAMSNTNDSLSKVLDMHDDYKSASLNDVERAVRAEIRLREENALLRQVLEKIADPRKRDHSEPDAYTQLGCVMHMAEEVLEKTKKNV